MPDYLDLRVGAPRRLRALKQAAEKLNGGHNARKAAGDDRPYTWREVRYCGFHNAASGRGQLSRGLNSGRLIWYAHTGEQFPRERYADEILNLRHTGWYTDVNGWHTARGIVVALPHGRFLAGYHWNDNGERVYFPGIYEEEEEAARAADGEAEIFARLARNDDERYQEARDLEISIEEKTYRLRECLALRNAACFQHLRKEARELIAGIRAARATLSEEYADYV